MRIVAALIFSYLGFMLAASPPGAREIDYGQYLHWVEGVATTNCAHAIACDGPYAYIAFGTKPGKENGLQIIDVSDPTAPSVRGQLATYAPAKGVAVGGDFVYLTTALDPAGTLEVLDVSVHHQPQVVGSVPLPYAGQEVTLDGPYAYVVTGNLGPGSLEVIDIGDPLDPITIASLEIPASVGSDLHGTHLYVVTLSEGLRVIDLADPAEPVVVGETPLPTWGSDVVVLDGYAYVAQRFEGGVYVVDVSDPAHPQCVSSLPCAGCTFGIDATGDRPFLASNADGLRVLDITHPGHPVDRGSYRLDSTFEVCIHGDYAYVSGGYGPHLEVFDISTPDLPPRLGCVDTPDFALDVAVSGGLAAIADRHGGLQIADVHDPWKPRLLAGIEVPDEAIDVAMTWKSAYVIDFTAGLMIVDVTRPTAPAVTSTYSTPGLAKAIDLVGDLAYVADWYGLCILDISDPAAPQLIGELPELDQVYDVEVSGDYAFLSIWGSGLQVVRIANPTHPLLVATLPIAGIAQGLAVDGGYAYLADWEAGLHVIDVSDPEAPIRIAGVRTTYRARDVEVVGSVAYAIYTHGIQLVDISDPRYPETIGQLPGVVYGAAVDGGSIYLAQGPDGIRIAPGHAAGAGAAGAAPAARLALIPPRPNPTAGGATLRFDTPVAGEVELVLCDLTGRAVRRILRQSVAAGFGTVQWDGRDDRGLPVSPGTYFIRMRGGGETHRARLVCVR